MNDISKAIRVGTVDFFGILVPGVLVITMWGLGFFLPIMALVMDLSNVKMSQIPIDTNNAILILFFLVIFSYVFGYILRLTSPDELDRKSARHVIAKEVQSGTDIEMDEWPFDPENEKDKFPYLNFRNYLIVRGHKHLTEDLVIWGPDDESCTDAQPEKKKSKKTISKAQRSKSIVNKMKMEIRFYCPELSFFLEGKEAHIRLMSGTWAGFKFSMTFVAIAFVITMFFGICQLLNGLPASWISAHNYFVFSFIDLSLWLSMFFANKQIEKLFHYRRVSELFHIVQAAYFAQQVSQKGTALTSNSKN
jgi:hypothetical protein